MNSDDEPNYLVTLPLREAMGKDSALIDFFTGGKVVLPEEGDAEERDVVFQIGEFSALKDLLEKFDADDQDLTPEQAAPVAQLNEAIGAIDEQIAQAPPVPVDAKYPDATIPAQTATVINVTVSNEPIDGQSYAIVVQKISCATVENYPPDLEIDSVEAYNTFLLSGSDYPKVGEAWELLYPNPDSDEAVSLPEFTVADDGDTENVSVGFSIFTTTGTDETAQAPRGVSIVYDLGSGGVEEPDLVEIRMNDGERTVEPVEAFPRLDESLSDGDENTASGGGLHSDPFYDPFSGDDRTDNDSAFDPFSSDDSDREHDSEPFDPYSGIGTSSTDPSEQPTPVDPDEFDPVE